MIHVRIIILKQKPTDLYISKLKLIKFSKQSTEPSEHEIYPNRENFQQFLNKLTFVGVIYLKLCKLKFWKSRLNPLALFFFWWRFHHKKGRLKMFISQTVKDSFIIISGACLSELQTFYHVNLIHGKKNSDFTQSTRKNSASISSVIFSIALLYEGRTF